MIRLVEKIKALSPNRQDLSTKNLQTTREWEVRESDKARMGRAGNARLARLLGIAAGKNLIRAREHDCLLPPTLR